MQYDVEDVCEVANQGKMNSAYLHSIRRLYEKHLVAMHCIMPLMLCGCYLLFYAVVGYIWLLCTVYIMPLIAMSASCYVMKLVAMSASCYVMKLVAMFTHRNLARCLGCYGYEVTGCYVRWTVVVVHVIATSPPHSIVAICNSKIRLIKT